jgi:hypothetical protein
MIVLAVRQTDAMTLLETKHGMSPADLTRMRAAQQGLCYLCGDPLPDGRARVAVDHDHRCCPRKKSCEYCRRGLACNRCNLLIGWAKDDPQLLRLIADNLEAANAAAAQRIASKPSQAAPFDPGARTLTKRPRPARRRPNVLDDVLSVFGDDKGMHWQMVAEWLAAQFPDRWTEVTASVISAQCRALGIPSADVRYPAGRRGANRRGCRRTDVIDVITQQTPLAA